MACSNKLYLIFIAAVGVCQWHCQSTDPLPAKHTYAVSRDSVLTLIESGELESRYPQTINAPGNWHLEYQIVYLPEEGSYVRQGDTVVIFDTRAVEQQLDAALKERAVLEEKLVETRLKNQQLINEKEAQIRKLEIQARIAENRLEQAQYNAESARQDARLELKKAQLNLTRARTDLKAQHIINSNQENGVLIDMDQTKIEIRRRREMINDMFITAPKDGLVVYFNKGRRGGGDKIKIGDTVRPLHPVLSLPDLNNMQVLTEINQVDRSYVRLGQQANILVEAYPDTAFTGRLFFISKVVDFSDQEPTAKTYYILIRLDSGENYRLKPGLTAQVTLHTDTLRHVLQIPSWCLFSQPEGYAVKSPGQGEVPVELVRLISGKAFVQGNLTAEDKLLPNQKIPLF